MNSFLACEAMSLVRRLSFFYDGFPRVVEIHTFGHSREGREMISVWQVRGGSASGESVGWKLMFLDKIVDAKLIEEAAEVPRDGYKRDAWQFASISRQL